MSPPMFAGFHGRPVLTGMWRAARSTAPWISFLGDRHGGGRGPFRFPRSLVRRGPSLLFGEAGMGVWGKTWNRAVVLRGRGGSGFSPSAFPDWSPLLSVYSRSRAVVFLTSPSCSC